MSADLDEPQAKKPAQTQRYFGRQLIARCQRIHWSIFFSPGSARFVIVPQTVRWGFTAAMGNTS